MSGPLRVRLGSALAATLLLALYAVALAGPATAAPSPTQGCTWQRHTKAVSTRVKRHGRVQRVKRLKHWWTCQPSRTTPLAQPALPVPATTEPTAGSEEPQPEPEVGHLGVKAVEWSYTLSRPQVSAGEVIVELNNQGEDAHNLVLEREESADAPLKLSPALPASQTSARLTLATGTYRLYCSLDDHAAKGMEATLLVDG